MGAEEAHKVERAGGRACASCTRALPVTADVCSSCREAFYCGPACQKAHWPQHKAACKQTRVSAPHLPRTNSRPGVSVMSTHSMLGGIC